MSAYLNAAIFGCRILFILRLFPSICIKSFNFCNSKGKILSPHAIQNLMFSARLKLSLWLNLTITLSERDVIVYDFEALVSCSAEPTRVGDLRAAESFLLSWQGDG